MKLKSTLLICFLALTIIFSGCSSEESELKKQEELEKQEQISSIYVYYTIEKDGWNLNNLKNGLMDLGVGTNHIKSKGSSSTDGVLTSNYEAMIKSNYDQVAGLNIIKNTEKTTITKIKASNPSKEVKSFAKENNIEFINS